MLSEQELAAWRSQAANNQCNGVIITSASLDALLDHIAAQAEAQADARQCAEHRLKVWREAQADAAAKTLVIEDILHNWWEEIYPADIFVGDLPESDWGAREVRRLRDAMFAALSGAAGKALLEELARLRLRCLCWRCTLHRAAMLPADPMPKPKPF